MFNSFWRNRTCKRRSRSKSNQGKLLIWLSALLLFFYLWSSNGKETGLKWSLLWGRISLSIRVQTTINHCRFGYLFACFLFLFCFVCFFFNPNIDVKCNHFFQCFTKIVTREKRCLSSWRQRQIGDLNATCGKNCLHGLVTYRVNINSFVLFLFHTKKDIALIDSQKL